jgi:hypothetical protein
VALDQDQDASRNGGGPAGRLRHATDGPTTSLKIERELQRRRHVCSSRCVVRADVERHYDLYSDQIVARLARWERVALYGWAIAAMAVVISEGLALLRR